MNVHRGNDAAVERFERFGLLLLSVAALATILWLVRPVGMGVLLGVLFAFTFRPIYDRLTRRCASSTAALLTVLGVAVSTLVAFGGLVWILVRGATAITHRLVVFFGAGRMQEALRGVDGWTRRFGVSSADLEAKARAAANSALAFATAIAQAIVAASAGMIIGTLFLMMTMFFILRRWHQVVTVLQESLPLRPEYTAKLLMEFRRIGRTTLLSTFAIGLLQGALAAAGYAIVGVPQPLFFGVLTAAASLVPGIGTMLVWLPVGVVLALVGHVPSGIFVVAWGLVVLTVIPTYVIRPRLVGGGEGGMPALFTFIALFGGAAVFGLKGLILGPVLMALAVAVLRLYAAEAHERRKVIA